MQRKLIPNLATRRAVLMGSAAAAALPLPLLARQGNDPLYTKGKRMVEAVFGQGVRKSASALTADSDDVRMYREMVGWMKKRSVENPLDTLGWKQHWAHHSFFCATNSFRLQIHYGWFFLPWHRAYLFNLEQKIRRVLNEPSFALPYWDWTRDQKSPEWFWGEDNPLSNSTRLQERGDVVPPDFLGLAPIFRTKNFSHFGGRPRTPGEVQVEGTLEQACHNNVHNWIGGEMASFDGAGNDPLFQVHHGQIDRLWEGWLAMGEGRANPEDSRWRDHLFWFYGMEGTPEYTSVHELSSTKDLGYTYDDLSFAETLTEENTPRFDGSGVDFGELPQSPLLRERMAAMLREGNPGRVSLNYERLSLPIQPFCHRLFFVPKDDGEAVYIGTFTILPIPDLTQGLERTVTSQVEVPPDAVAALLRDRHMHVVGVPVPLKGRNIPEEPVPFGGVSLTVDPA